MAAAVGSLMMRRTLRPEMAPASLVACRWLSLKYAGTVMTAFSTFLPSFVSATSFIYVLSATVRSCEAGSAHLAQHHGRDLLWGECLRLAQVLDLDFRVVLEVHDLEWPRFDILLDGGIIESSSNEAPERMLDNQFV